MTKVPEREAIGIYLAYSKYSDDVNMGVGDDETHTLSNGRSYGNGFFKGLGGGVGVGLRYMLTKLVMLDFAYLLSPISVDSESGELVLTYDNREIAPEISSYGLRGKIAAKYKIAEKFDLYGGIGMTYLPIKYTFNDMSEEETVVTEDGEEVGERDEATGDGAFSGNSDYEVKESLNQMFLTLGGEWKLKSRLGLMLSFNYNLSGLKGEEYYFQVSEPTVTRWLVYQLDIPALVFELSLALYF